MDEVQPRDGDQGHQPGQDDGPVAPQGRFEGRQDFRANFWNV